MTGALKFWDGTAWQFAGGGPPGPAGPAGATGPQGGFGLTPVSVGSDITATVNTTIILGGSPGKTITLPTTPANGSVVQVVAQTGPHTIAGNGTEKLIWFAAGLLLVNSLSVAAGAVMTLQFGSGSPGGWTVVNNPPLATPVVHYIGASGEPTFTNSWVNSDNGLTTPGGGTNRDAGYYKDSTGRVWLTGTIKTGTTGTTAFTLPAGFRPKQNVQVPIEAGNPCIPVRLVIMSTGAVQPTDTAGVLGGGVAFFTFLDPASFIQGA